MGFIDYKNIFFGKKIILGITGSIAAYKSLLLIRELQRKGAEIFPILTPAATNFVTPLSVSNLAKNQVAIDMFDPDLQKKGAWHIDLVHQADLMIIAPATASTIAKIANGICDNALVTLATALPGNIPLLVAPAMDTSMWINPTTQNNLRKLKNNGAIIIPPATGELSSGLIGEGRLPEVPAMVDYIETFLYFKETGLDNYKNLISRFSNKNILITSGPTFEKIDDIRYISNFSTGKMGFSLAIQAKILGANVNLISGPTSQELYHDINLSKIQSAQDLYDKVIENYTNSNIIIMASAVADFTPEQKIHGKFKKEEADELLLKLVRTKDILYEIGQLKKKSQILVGFALESSKSGFINAWKKLVHKNCDMIVLNYFDRPYSGFGENFNTVTTLHFENDSELVIEDLPTMSKNLCALVILEKISKLLRVE